MFFPKYLVSEVVGDRNHAGSFGLLFSAHLKNFGNRQTTSKVAQFLGRFPRRILNPKHPLLQWLFGETTMFHVKIWLIIQLKQPFVNDYFRYQEVIPYFMVTLMQHPKESSDPLCGEL